MQQIRHSHGLDVAAYHVFLCLVGFSYYLRDLESQSENIIYIRDYSLELKK